MPARREGVGWGALAFAAAIAGSWWMRGFTIDDALISIRYAEHLARGLGWRFNPDALPTDGVTPLPWPIVIAPLTYAGPLAALIRVKVAGAITWAITAGALGVKMHRERTPIYAIVIVIAAIALSEPLAAHAVSGMETCLATALATFAVLTQRPRVGAFLAGLAGALRPEMTPWALAIALALAWSALSPDATPTTKARAIMTSLAVAIAPFALCTIARLMMFGHVAPLALLAKPSDLTHGVAYAGAALLSTIAPILALSPMALTKRNLPSIVRARGIGIAALVHVIVIATVGGDWMPYARLLVPILPSLLYAFALTSKHARARWTVARVTIAFALAIYVRAVGPSGREVLADRLAMVHAIAPSLEGAKRIASLDIGWPTLLDGDRTIVDLAGVTDPTIASLPGGHTSKRIDASLLLAEDPDALLLYTDRDATSPLEQWRDAHYPRVVEQRFARDEITASHFAPRAIVPLGDRGAGYVVLLRSP